MQKVWVSIFKVKVTVQAQLDPQNITTVFSISPVLLNLLKPNVAYGGASSTAGVFTSVCDYCCHGQGHSEG